MSGTDRSVCDKPPGPPFSDRTLANPWLQGEGMVRLPRPGAVDRDRGHDEVGARQRLAPVGRRVDPGVPVGGRVEAFGEPGHPGQGIGIDVDQPELGAAEFRDAEDVAQQLDPEDDAADADGDQLHDARTGSASFIASPLTCRMSEA